MAGKLQLFQTMSFKGWASPITKKNHLGSMLAAAPQQAAPAMIQLLAVDHGKDLDIFLSQFATKQFPTDDDYTWDLIGSARRNIPLAEARDEEGNVITSTSDKMVGVGGAPFELVFEEAWFYNGEILFGELNEKYPMRVLAEPRYEGTRAVYTVSLTGSASKGIPAEELTTGKKFSYAFAPVSRGLSREVGGKLKLVLCHLAA